MRIKRAVIDMDGVLTDFVTGLERHLGIPEIYSDPKLLGVWDFSPHLGIDLSVLDHNFWLNLDFMPDGLRILAEVEAAVGIQNVCVLSTPVGGDSAKGKIHWIEKHLPDYRKRYLLGAPKDFCMHPEMVLIDDADHNIKAYKGPSILVPRIWNAGHSMKIEATEHVRRELFRLG